MQGVLKVARSEKGALVVEVEIGGKMNSVPRAGRADEKLLWQYHGKVVEVQRSDSGTVSLIRAGGTVLFRAGGKPAGKKPAPARGHAAQTGGGLDGKNEKRQGESGKVDDLKLVSQKRAAHALKAVNAWKESKGKEEHKELRSYVASMPAMMLISGFGQTCAFYKSKGGNHEKVLKAVEDWLGRGDLIEFITGSTASEYQIAQAEALEYLAWLKKFAKAYLTDGKNDNAAAA